jgi:hypothetical protein
MNPVYPQYLKSVSLNSRPVMTLDFSDTNGFKPLFTVIMILVAYVQSVNIWNALVRLFISQVW